VSVRRHHTPEEGKRALGAAIVYYRERAGWTTPQLARRAGITPANLRRIERGQAEPHWGTARRIAEAVPVALDQLIVKAEKFEREGGAPASDGGGVGT
jgi:transcriptional regulator with XRE-family HTH domain